MRIIETAILSHNKIYFQELAETLELQNDSVMGINVLRMEIEPDFSVLMYDLPVDKQLSGEVIEHLKDHLSSLMIITDDAIANLSDEGRVFVDEFAKDLINKPTVIAVRSTAEKAQRFNRVSGENGFYLSGQGRVLFWHPAIAVSRKQVWKTLWSTLHPA